MTLPTLLQGALATLVAVAAINDLRSRTIPNWLVLAGIAGGFTLNPWISGWPGLKDASLGFGVALLVYLPLFLLRAMGGGDVKLMAAVGSLSGPQNWLVIFVLTAIVGGVVALAVVLFRGAVGRTVRNIAGLIGNLARGRAPWSGNDALQVGGSSAMTLPHGFAIAIGTAVFLLFS